MSTERSLKKTTAAKGKVEIIRPSKLALDGVTGEVAAGVYEGAKPNKYDAKKSDYFIRGADNTLFILNETTGLKEQLSQLEGMEGVTVRVIYNGKVPTKSGKGYHDFDVRVK